MNASTSTDQTQSRSAELPEPFGVQINPRGVFRAAARSVGLLGVLAAAAVHYALTIPHVPMRDRLRKRALWLQRWSRNCARVMGLRIDQHGVAPTSGMIVSNHLSYLDILAFSAITPCVFVAKKQVASWPLLGFFARLAGTIFVNRASRMDVARANSQIERALSAGATVLLFAEGTSSDGRTVLPFRPALLEPMIRTQCPATPAAVCYSIAAGSVEEEVCYWRDMTLLPHLLKLMSKLGVDAHVAFAAQVYTFVSRRVAAAELHSTVTDLHRTLGQERTMPCQ